MWKPEYASLISVVNFSWRVGWVLTMTCGCLMPLRLANRGLFVVLPSMNWKSGFSLEFVLNYYVWKCFIRVKSKLEIITNVCLCLEMYCKLAICILRTTKFTQNTAYLKKVFTFILITLKPLFTFLINLRKRKVVIKKDNVHWEKTCRIK